MVHKCNIGKVDPNSLHENVQDKFLMVIWSSGQPGCPRSLVGLHMSGSSVTQKCCLGMLKNTFTEEKTEHINLPLDY